MLSQTILLAAVQGLTEFLPVSSSGHLVAVRLLFGIPDVQGTAFDAFLHLGTLLAVLVYYRHVWVGIMRGLLGGGEEAKDRQDLAAKLAIATIPGAIVGYAFEDTIGGIFRTADAVGAGLLFTACLLLVGDTLSRRMASRHRATFADAVYIGLAQVLALVPGVSRSGTTIAAGLLRGLPRKQAIHFSFLMSAPIIAGAGLSNLPELLNGGSYPIVELVIGAAISFVFGFIAIHALVRLVEKISFKPFVVYLVGLAMVLFLRG